MRTIQNWWNALVSLGTAGLSEYDQKKRVTVGVNRMCLSVGILTLTMGTFVCLIVGDPKITIGVYVEAVSLIAPLLFNYHRKYTEAKLAIYMIMALATLFFGCILGKSINAQLMIGFLIGVSLFMFPSRTYRIICITVTFVILIALEENNVFKIVTPLEMGPQTQILTKWAAYVAIFALIIVAYHMYRKNDRELQNDLERSLEKETKEHKQKDKFITNAGHEMRVSFKSIFSIIGILEKDMLKDSVSPKIHRNMKNLQAACKSTQNVADNFLELEKHNAGIPTQNRENIFQPKMLFQSIVEVYSYVGNENNIKIRLSIGNEVPTHIQTDDVKIRHILSNLLDNAVKYASDDSTVLVKCNVRKNTLIFSVKNAGKRIPPQVNIFEPFVTTNPEGLGIGLFIVKESINSLNGDIVVASTDAGTQFTINIPLTPLQNMIQAVRHVHN